MDLATATRYRTLILLLHEGDDSRRGWCRRRSCRRPIGGRAPPWSPVTFSIASNISSYALSSVVPTITVICSVASSFADQQTQEETRFETRGRRTRKGAGKAAFKEEKGAAIGVGQA
ncbi:hypothetical protein OPV22_011782 [Ensete ventricosum]|uniref:Uncharacterized protein n=1 Tax=Ensete ventricosum TaxID=4639 RepID=A0AAV8Q6C0_ENSVE|nr:hypothetical protein OPV22_011782 [Ensete ventricosum]